MSETSGELSGTQIAVETGHGIEKQPGATEERPQAEPAVRRGIGRKGILAAMAVLTSGLLGNTSTEQPQGKGK